MNTVAAPAANAAAVVDVRRVIQASPEDLFAAWLDPAALAQWLRPFDTSRTDATVDARAGGRFTLDMHTPGGVVAHRGEYLEIVQDKKIVFTWNSPHTNGDSLVTVSFTPQGSGTEVRVLHEKLPADKIDAHNGGWSTGLDKLVAFAEQRGA
jgi:uncharacterized protein YndB with AHSA1/START domain